jgi:hypothetical protein
VLTERASAVLVDPAGVLLADQDSAVTFDVTVPPAFSRDGWDEDDPGSQYITEEIKQPPITRPDIQPPPGECCAPGSCEICDPARHADLVRRDDLPGYHGEGQLADFDPGSGYSSQDEGNKD